MIKLIKQPVNREQKRKMYFEYKRNASKLIDAENAFLTALFTEDATFSYKELYDFYLTNYNNLIGWMQKNRMFKVTVPDTYYFSNEYYPLEK